MNDLAGKPRKDINGFSIPKPQKRTSRWTILFVGDHGKVVSVGRLKGVAIASILAITVVVAITAWLFYLYRSNAQDNSRLQNALQTSKQKITALRTAKDQLMVRLVLAEAKINAGQVGSKTKTIEARPDISQDKSTSATVKPKPANLKATETEAELPVEQSALVSAAAAGTPGVVAENIQAEEPQFVGVEKLMVLYEMDKKRLKVTFILRKTDPSTESVSGRAFVILKNNTVEQKQWLTIPSVSLVSGKPSRIYRGQYFSIVRFKPMKFERKVIDPDRFKNVTVFIFTKEGKLLLEKELPITIQNVLSLPDE